jgi:cobalamin biosynthesis protein CbiG
LRFAVGIGARSGVEACEVVELVEAVLATCEPPRLPFSARVRRKARVEIALFSIESKRDERGLHEAARILETTIAFLPREALVARNHELITRSPRVEALTGVGSVAEAAALVGAGPGSVLLGPRVASARATCAIARNALEQSA